jgi:hypothetical protein
MLKNKLISSLIIAAGLFLMAQPIKASPVVYIQSLPGYINYTDFKLSCTSDGSTAQFYSKKDGGDYAAFGPSINLAVNPCLVQVTGLQFGSEGKFWFQVIVDGVSTETSVTLDTTAPDKVSDFGKDRSNGGVTYKIYWKNPTNTDYARVFIYRGIEAGFNADDSHKVAEAGGNPGDTMSWDDSGLDSNKDYFYVIRALDKANNASDMVGDRGPDTYVQVLGASASPAAKKTTTVALPKEKGTGSVLGTEETPAGSASPEISAESLNTNPGVFKWILTHKKISGGVLLVLLVAAYGIYRFKKRSI